MGPIRQHSLSAMDRGDFGGRLLFEAGIRQKMRILQVGSSALHLPAAESGGLVRADLAQLPLSGADFDAVIGRYVLIDQPEPLATVECLARHLKPGGRIVLQEIDLAADSLRLPPLHQQVHGWLRGVTRMNGRDLHQVLTRAGLTVEGVRAQAVVRTLDLAELVATMLPRILELGVANSEEVAVGTLQARLDAERSQFGGNFLGDMNYGAWARR